MSPLRHLRMAAHQLRRRERLLLSALLASSALLMLLMMVDHGPRYQPAWQARLPAAATAGAPRGKPEESDAGVRLTGDRADPAQRRSYVSGKRFVDFDPTATLSGTTGEEVQALKRDSEVEKINKSGPLSNVLLTSKDMTIKKKAIAHKHAVNSPSSKITDKTDSKGGAGDSNATSSLKVQPNPPAPLLPTAVSSPASGAGPAVPAEHPVSQELATDSASDPASDIGTYELPGCGCSRTFSKFAYRALNGTRSSCGLTSDLRGAGQNVISFSFYGNASSVFFGGISANLARVPDTYPGWVVRVYNDIDLSIPEQKKLVCDVQCRYDNVDFCDVRDLPGLGDLSKKFGMIWRFMPLADDTVERFIVRDLDSLIGSRERAAVDDWIASNRTFHAMRDAPAHGTEILGGMWGGWNRYNQVYRRIRDRIIKVTQWRFKGLDQRVLTVVLWPEIVRHRDLIAHDSYLCFYYPMTRPFPTKRESPFDFVGSPSLIDKGFRLQSHCPYFCRPREHRDWEWC